MSDEEVVGTAIIRVVVDRSGVQSEIDRAVEEANRRAGQGNRAQGSRRGREYGDAFTTALQTRLESALRKLPQIEITANTSAADAKLETLRTQLYQLTHTKELGIQISDTQAIVRIREIEAELKTLTGPDHDIRMRVNAGAAIAQIEALKRTLGQTNEDAFARTLRSKIEGAVRDLPDLKIGVNASAAEVQIAALRERLRQLGSGELGVDLHSGEAIAKIKEISVELKSLTTPAHDIRIRTNALAALAQIEALRLAVGDLEKKSTAASAAADALPKRLLAWALLLSPVLVPIAGSLLAIGSAAFGAGLAGVAAFQSIRAEVKAGTDVGVQYKAGIQDIKGAYGGLHSSLAKDLLPAFNQIKQIAISTGPAVRSELSGIAKETAPILTHLIGGLAGGLKTFKPLMDEVLAGASRTASKFEQWATGPGGAKFAQTLATDFKAAGPPLADLLHFLEQIFAAVNGPGLSLLKLFGDVASAIDSIPQPVLTVLLDSLIALKTVGIISALFDKFALSVRGAAVAEGEAAAASAAMRNRLGDAVGFLGKVATGFIVAQIAGSELQRVSESGLTSTNSWTRGLSEAGKTVGDLLTLNIGGFIDDLTGGFDKTEAAAAHATDTMVKVDYALHYAAGHAHDAGGQFSFAAEAMRGLSDENAKYGSTSADAIGGLGSSAKGVGLSLGVLATGAQGAAKQVSVAAQIAQSYNSHLKDLNATIANQIAITSHVPTVSGGAGALSSLADGLQKQIEKTEKFLALGGPTIETYKGVAIGSKTYDAALAQTNGDLYAAIGLIHSAVDGHTALGVALTATANRQARLNDFQGAAEAKYKITAEQVDLYAAAIGLTADKIDASAASQKAATAYLGQFITVLSNGSTAINTWIAAIAAFDKAGDTAASRGALIGEALRAANGDMLSFAKTMVNTATANQQFVTDLKNVAKGVINLKTGMLDWHNAAAAPLINDLQNIQDANVSAAAAIYQHELATKGSKKAADDAFATYQNNTRTQLIDEAERLGYTSTQAKGLADQFLSIKNSGDLKKKIELLGEDKITTALKGILKDLDILVRGSWTFNVGANITPAAVKVINLLAPGTRHSSNITVSAIAQGGVFKAYAQGGTENHLPELASTKPGTVRVWNEPETQGEAYIPLANDSRRPRAKELTQTVAAKLGGVAYFQTGGETGGFAGVDYGGGSGTSGGGGSKSGGSSSKGALSLSVLNEFLRSLPGTLAAIERAEQALAVAVSRAVGGKSLLGWLADENKQLVVLAKQRDRIAGEIAKAQTHYQDVLQQYQQTRTSTSGAVGSFFNIASAGVAPTGGLPTLGNIEAQQLQALNQVRQFQSGLTKLIHEGFDKNYVMQLASQGPGALAQVVALSRASPREISLINSRERAISAAGAQLGVTVAKYEYGTQLNVAHALLYGFDPHNRIMAREVKVLADKLFGVGKYLQSGLAAGLRSENSILTRAVEALGAHIIAVLKAKLKIHSPSAVGHEIGTNFASSIALGMNHGEPAIRKAAYSLANATGLENRRHHPAAALPAARGSDTMDPDVRALIQAMRDWFAHPPQMAVDGIAFGKLVSTVAAVEGRRN